MLRLLPPEEIANVELVPQAVVRKSPLFFAEQFGIGSHQGFDEFDSYEGFDCILDNEMPFAIRHYQGHPSGTMTVYLPIQYRDVEEVSRKVALVFAQLHVGDFDVIWQRRDDPEL